MILSTNTELLTPEEAKSTAEELNYSRDIYARRAGDYPEVQAALDFFYEKITSGYKIKQARDLKKYRHQIRVFVLDLYVANQIDPLMYITFPRGKRSYYPGTKHHRMRLSHRIATNIADFLESQGYIDQKKGFYKRDDRGGGKGKVTRIRAKEKFRSLLQVEFKVEIGMFIWDWDDTTPTVVLRNEDKEGQTYEDTEETLRMKENLALINRTLERFPILLHVTDDEYWAFATKIRDDSNKGVPDFTRKFVKRVFNNGSLTQGGRFYDGWWQNIPRECRQFIRINDKDVVECDYSGLHVNMLYAIENFPMPEGDVYRDIPGYYNSNTLRAFVKQLLLIIVNSGTEKEAVKAIHKSVHLDKEVKLPKDQVPTTSTEDIIPLVKAFGEKHHKISQYFCSGKGIDLQYLDSQIAEQVMVHFSKMGYPILPMHDSFIIHHGLEQELKDCMNQAFRKMFGVNISVDLKYNSITERQKRTLPRDDDNLKSHVCDLTLEEISEQQKEFGIYYNLLNQFRRYKQKLF